MPRTVSFTRAEKTMVKAKKATGSAPIADVAQPGMTPPSDTSKPIITHRPMIKDPMVTEEEAPAGQTAEKPLQRKTARTTIEPPEEPAPSPKPEKKEEPVPETEPQNEPEPEAEKGKPATPDPEAETDARTAQDAHIQKIIDSKKYFLPINAVEQRKSKRFVALGVFLALVLALAWVDIALDAGLIHIDGIKPATHFFSN